MYYIEARNDSRKWISAIFMDRKKAEIYLDSIPELLRSIQTLYEIPVNAYPVYLVEGNEFHFCDLDGLHATLLSVEINPDFDDSDAIYLNIYKISEDFASRKPGADHMGWLHHIHVGNSFIKHYPRGEQAVDPFIDPDSP